MGRFISIAFAAFLAGCGAAPPPGPASTSVTVQAMARGAVETAETVWLDAAQGCVDAAQAGGGQALLDKCQAVLIPARDSLVAAAGALDGWQDGERGNVACAVQDALMSVDAVVPMLGLSASEKSLITDAKALANALGTCARDGGK